MTAGDRWVFVPGLGFRSNRGLRLPESVTEAKGEGRALRVMSLVSTDSGTELAFELHDREREQEAAASVTDPRWNQGTTVRLRDASGAAIAELPPGRGQRFSFGQHTFGEFRRELVFEPLGSDVRRVSVEIRGGLGEWDVPLRLLPIAETAVIAVARVGAAQERDGITVRIRGFAQTETATYLDIEAVSVSPTESILGIRAWMGRSGEERLALVDQRGQRIEEVSDPSLPRPNPRDGTHTVATFPPIPADSTDLTLVVPRVNVHESEGRMDLKLPVYTPTDVIFGPYPMVIRWADFVDDLRGAPGAAPSRGVAVQLQHRDTDNGRRVLQPRRVEVDGARQWNVGFDYADSKTISMSIHLRAGESPKTITFLEPEVEVRGPWEIRWRRSS